jgi:plastocyanin/uncharacterized membrane protein YozB (DUF420 family)
VGFLGTGATFAADLNLVVQLAMGAALVTGMFLARRKNYRLHARCQASVVLLNLVMIVLIMAPQFHKQVEPNLAQITTDRYYTLPFFHAALGTVAEVLGLYVILVAGTDMIPKSLRFDNYKPWMRTTLALWWTVIGLGVATYVVWYVSEQPAQAAQTKPGAADTQADKQKEAAGDTVQIAVENFKFTPNPVTIKVGTTVVWTDKGGRHTVQTADGYIKSDILTADKTYSKKFDKPGTYTYYCDFHGDKSGTGMSGKITVTAK